MQWQAVEATARALGLEDVEIVEDARVTRNIKGFTFQLSGHWHICISSHLEPEERAFTAYHELAHIYLGHKGNALVGGVNPAQEIDANELAALLMHCPPGGSHD